MDGAMHRTAAQGSALKSKKSKKEKTAAQTEQNS
jgi:hypothetical protein